MVHPQVKNTGNECGESRSDALQDLVGVPHFLIQFVWSTSSSIIISFKSFYSFFPSSLLWDQTLKFWSEVHGPSAIHS